MVEAQVERLKTDLKQLDEFVSSLKQEGRVDLAKKVLTKREYLDEYIQTAITN